MSLNEEIQMSLLVFVQRKNIKNCAFGELKDLFFEAYPQYQDSKYYHSLYRALQNLCKSKHVSIDKSTSPFKYSSNSASVKNTNSIEDLNGEMGKINFSIYALNCDLFWYRKYIKEFPNLSKEINLEIESANKQLYSLYSKKKVLKKIITHLKS